MKYKILACLIASSLALNASAAVTNVKTTKTTTTTNNVQAALEKATPYVGFGLGYGKIDTGIPGYNDGGFAWNVNGGVLWKHMKFAYGPEIGFSHFPSSTADNAKVKGNSIDILAVGRYYFAQRFNATVKAGMSFAMQRADGGTGFPGGATSKTNLAPTIYMGAGYEVVKNVMVTAGYQYINGSKPMYAVLGGLTVSL